MYCGASGRIEETRPVRAQESFAESAPDPRTLGDSETRPGYSYRRAGFLAEAARPHTAIAPYAGRPSPPASSARSVVYPVRAARSLQLAGIPRNTEFYPLQYEPRSAPPP